MSSKASKLKGIVRISVRYNQPWNGFTLQQGHFYGQTKSGIYYVSGLEKNANGSVKVYICDTSSGNYIWHYEYRKTSDELVKAMILALPERKALGFESVTFQPVDHMKTGFNPRITRWDITSYTNIHIPSAGRPERNSYIVSESGSKKPIQNFC